MLRALLSCCIATCLHGGGHVDGTAKSCRLAIACYLVFQGCHGDPAAVTALVRCKRPGALQTRQQERFVNVFACYLQHLRCVPGAKSLLDPSLL